MGENRSTPAAALLGLLIGCSLGGDNGDKNFGSGVVTSVGTDSGDGTDASGSSNSDSNSNSDSDSASASASATTSASSDSATTDDSSSASATATATTGTASATATTSTSGGNTTNTTGGPACTNPGDLVVSGTVGPANANQNCPTTTYTANVAGAAGPITDVELLFNADVATTSEFTLTLTSPGNTTVTLFDKHGGPFSDDFVGTLFDDGATMPIATAPAPRTGCFSPDQPLSAFNGQAADGNWTLTVQTCLFAVNINSWELRLTF